MRSSQKCFQTRKLAIKTLSPCNASTLKRGSRVANNAEEFYFGVVCPRLPKKGG